MLSNKGMGTSNNSLSVVTGKQVAQCNVSKLANGLTAERPEDVFEDHYALNIQFFGVFGWEQGHC